MGKSRIINCIGETEQNKDGIAELFFANTSLEVLQEIKNNPDAKYWLAQTKVGQKILHLKVDEGEHYISSDEFLRRCKLKTISCVCTKGCFICNYSGLTTKKHVNRFLDWQIERAKNGK